MIANRNKHQSSTEHGKGSNDVDMQVAMHYGIPFTSSILAVDPVQRLLAVGTLDGRIKVIGGDNIEGLFISPKKVPYKYLEFLHNQGFIVGISNENEIQVWDMELRQVADYLQWDANITAFSVIPGACLMYIGDENGLLSVIKYDNEDRKLSRLQYYIPAYALAEAAGVSFLDAQPIVGILPQPGTSCMRFLVAYEKGLLILWDISQGLVVSVRGHSELQFKTEVYNNTQIDVGNELQSSVAHTEEEEKEICSLCWASTTGFVLAVGYINGDILLWDFSSNSSVKGKQTGQVSSNKVIKLQLAPGKLRLPVIVLHWSASMKADNNKGGQLFIYGGDEIGSEEVLTVLSLEWSSGIETLRCISRIALNLNGSFADMILMPNPGDLEKSSTAALFVLTNPGQLSVFDGAILSLLQAKEGSKPSTQAEAFPLVLPMMDPCITVSNIWVIPPGQSPSKDFLKKTCVVRTSMPTLSAGTKWPLTGGVPTITYEDHGVEKIFVAGYQDGSVRIFDATCLVLAPMFVLEGQLPVSTLAGADAAVSTLAFCSISMTLAVGDGSGLIRIYKLQQSSNESIFHFVSETDHEVHNVQHGNGVHCIAAFSLLKSPVRNIQFRGSGDYCAVGFESGLVVMLDLTQLSVVYRTDCLSNTNSSIISLSSHTIHKNKVPVSSPKQLVSETMTSLAEIMLVLSKDAHILIIDSQTGAILSSRSLQLNKDSLAISMYVIDSNPPVHKKASQILPDDGDIVRSENFDKNGTQETEECCTMDDLNYSEALVDPLLILCFADSLCLYSLKSFMEGDSSSYIQKMNLTKHCCWSTIFKINELFGLILLYDTGVLEIRSLPDFEVKTENSLMALLGWSFKTDMNRIMSSTSDGQFAMVNGSEVAFVSVLEHPLSILDSFPCLHDKVLAAAAAAAINLTDQQKRQNASAGIFGGIIRGLTGGKSGTNITIADSDNSHIQKLEELFSKAPFSDQFLLGEIELNLDDIVIEDEVLPTAPMIATSNIPTYSKTASNEEKEREKLFQGSSQVDKPKVRTTEEIRTKYQFGGDAAAAAAHAREKLAERQEKLQKISEHTQELQDNAENFASMAHQLAKKMENKKWWQL